MLRRFVSLSLPLVLLPTLGAAPTHAQLGPDQAVTVENSTGFLHIVDSSTTPPSVVSSLFLGTDVADVTVTPDGTTALVTSFSDQLLTYVDLATLTVTGSTSIPGFLAEDVDVSCTSGGFAVITDGQLGTRVIVVNLGTQSIVSDYDLVNLQVQSNAVSPDGSLVLVTSFQSDLVRVLQMSPAGALTDTGQDVTVGVGPINVAFSPDGQKALVANSGSTVAVLAISGTTVTRTQNIAFAGATPQTVAYSNAGDRAYMLDCGSNRIFRLNIDAFGFVSQAGSFSHSGTAPSCFFGIDQIAVSPDGATVYARYPGGLSVLDPVSGTGTSVAIAGIGGGIVAPCDAGTGTNLPPVITCNDPVELWSPQHDLVDIGSAFSVQDPDAGPGDVLTVSVRVFSNESEIPETGDGSGKHAPDFKDESGGRGLLVRSERRGNGDGRWYVLVITADDGQGGVTTVACGGGACPKSQSEESMADVMAQLDAAVADIQAALDAPTPLDQLGYYEHGQSAEMGPKQ